MPVQKHIHLDTEVGGSPENAPTRTWKTIARKKVPVAFVNVRRSRKGYLLPNVLLDENGDEVQLTNFLFRIKVAATDSETVDEQEAALVAFQGKTVYFVDHNHPDDGADHDEHVRTMFCSRVGELDSGEDRGLRFYYVEVELEDYSL